MVMLVKVTRLLFAHPRIAVAGIALISFAAVAPVALYVLPERANAAAAAEAEAVPGADALTDLEGRSPGTRLVGIALKATKVASRALAAQAPAPAEPVQRALGNVIDPPALGLPGPAPVVLPGEPELPPEVQLASAPGFFGGVPSGSSGGFMFVPPGGSSGGSSGGGIGSSGGSSSSSSSSGGSSGGGEPPPPIGAVPEPSTWAMMILGFGAIGGAMRRRARRDRLPAQA